MSKTAQPVVHSLHCTACDEMKESITMELCPACEQAMLRALPTSYFEVTEQISIEEPEPSAEMVLRELALAA